MFGYFHHEVCKGLERQDFIRFSGQFRQVIHDNIPTIQELMFLDAPQEQPAVLPTEKKEEEKLRVAMEKAGVLENPVLSGKFLFLPFSVGSSIVIARARGLDDYLIRKIGKDWLQGLCDLLLREFLLIKRASVDSLTGLLSSLHLEECLDGELTEHPGTLLLMTVYPKSSSSFQAKKYQHRTVALLQRFVKDRFPIYYLGQSCFALICEDCSAEFAAKFAPSLVNHLKRERCSRVHVAGVRFNGETDKVESSGSRSEEIMKKAWAALHVATKRGPFAFCNYSAIEDADKHPLAPASPRLRSWLQRATRCLEHFSLIEFASDGEQLADSVLKVVGSDGASIVENNRLYLLLPGRDAKQAKQAGKKILDHFSRRSESAQPLSAGIATYPLGNCRKSESLLNCRKALCHADFLDPGVLVVCDAVSFNISGDIYYGDGDLVRGVKEYRRGLELEPANGNLLNSLGVCYAQMNRHKPAVQCFQKACESKTDQFMAFYNLGLEHQIRKENSHAIDAFSQGLALPDGEGEDKARMDMSFQLGVLHIEEGEEQKALELLLPWYELERKDGGGQKAVRFLGLACYGLGKLRDAMTYLQRAVSLDEYDAEALGFLGEIYMRENEGDDIALRFCEKAVELSPDSLSLRLRLAMTQIQCGDLQGAGKNIQPCLRNRNIRPAALIQRGVLAREQGQAKGAEMWFAKAESCVGASPELIAAAKQHIKEIMN